MLKQIIFVYNYNSKILSNFKQKINEFYLLDIRWLKRVDNGSTINFRALIAPECTSSSHFYS